MFGFGKNALQDRIDALVADNLRLERDKSRLLREVADTGVMLTSARDSRDIAFRRCTHLEAENAQLARDIEGLLPDAERYRAQKAVRTRNLKQFQADQPATH